MSAKINKSVLVSFFFVFFFKLVSGQNLEVEGEAKISQMQLKNTADSVVVRLSDGTLAIRDVSSLPTSSGGWTLVTGGRE